MALNSDSRVGPYEILAPLGAGGMGEVYRARDPRLGREVAIKVLPSEFSANPDRLRRFEQEARAAGLLNHPNILAIYDIGSHDGAPYIVSELLEGETLRDRFKEGALSTRKAIEYGVQTAHGLATAHEKGIVHRDLKPENIFITRDGRVKILDFGLAKLTRPEDAGAALTSLPTTPSGTEAGMVMGTVGYMSPEQVRAKPTDARSDIFSFGVILYEMLSGQRAFHRESNVETMNAILKEEPPELTALGKNIPPGLDRVVTHCIEKSAEQRFQSARDLAFALEALSGISSSASGALPAIKADGFRVPVQAIAVAALAGLLALTLGYFMGHRAASRGPTQQPAYRRLTFRRGTVFAARFTPDGKTIAYSATWQGGPTELYTVRTEFPESLPIGLSGTNLLAMSSSGELAVAIGGQSLPHGFYRGTLGRTPLSGGTPRKILDDVEWADWSPDGTNLAVVHVVAGKRRLEYPIGKVLYETTGWVSHPRISPKGDRIAFLDHPIWPDDRGSVAVVDLSGKKTTISTGWSSEDGLAWSVSGKEVWFTATASGTGRWLYAASLSGRVRTVASVAGGMTLQDIFTDGRALVTRDDERVGTMGLAPGEKNERDLSWLDWSYVTDISSDGKKIAFSEQGEGGGPTYAACIRATDGTPPVRLGEGNALTISPDGNWMLSNTPGTPERLMILPTGSGTSRSVGAGNLEIYRGAGWLPDGKSIVFSAKESGGDYRTYLQNIDGGSPKPITPEGTYAVLVSHDGKEILTFDFKGGWWAYPIAGGEKHPVTGIEPGEQVIQWSSDGRSLYVAKLGLPPVKVYKLDLTTHQRVLWKEFGPAGRAGLVGIGPIKITPDGKAYAYSYHEGLSDLYLAEGLN